MPTITEIPLVRSGLGKADDGWTVHIGFAETDPPRLRLHVGRPEADADPELEHWVGLGDTFPIGEQTWRFADIQFRGGPSRFIAVLRYVPPGAAPFTPPPLEGDRIWRRIVLHPQGGTDEASVAAFERETGRRLPPHYREWLIETNGVLPAQLCQVPGDSHVILDPIHPTLGLHPEDPGLDLRYGLVRARGYFGDDHLVIATSPVGLIAVRTTPPTDRIVSLEYLRGRYANGYEIAGYPSPEAYVAAELVVECAVNIFAFEAALQPLNI